MKIDTIDTKSKNFTLMLELIHNHAQSLGSYAPWFLASLIILAGFNIPISADIIVLCAALLAAAMPEKALILFFSVYFGCIFSAWVAHFIGRFLGPRLLKIRWFQKVMSEKRLIKIRTFYAKHGFLTLLVGRFIPFGIRNCMFMTTGMAKVSFRKFALRDLVACFLWCATLFSLFFFLAEHKEALQRHMKSLNIFLFAFFTVAVIAFIWYKRRKKNLSHTSDS